ncbi:c-type cytochrome biogenesis protein CcmI [Ignatzschineria ureiclastica]|uniref:C-type cytochrome biogenesis protein CcmI n=1 Tax=Ignatzschineria ureiclastica TaxID=472582 RepID=A0A2U2AHP2_9GAMM|nr:c-type cytochrome biogenesis protein CcmI [Ignatzschineria ureiclastica]PWD82109.1 c-type cytochrome biogenesis protein CcmI [Ignatzschineria ureiclastica]GGZ92685.1 hypothetical protein GCM10007162_05290 [Ignatzschineria ureiclastica]
MTTLGIIYTLLFLIISVGLLCYALWGKGSQQYPRLKDVYRDKYLDETESLEDDLTRGKIDQAEYDEKKTELARDLLEVAKPDRSLNSLSKGIIAIFGLAIIGLFSTTFWEDGYSKEAKELDTQRTIALPYVKEWLASTPLEVLQRGETIADLNPPEALQYNLLGTLAALNLMSSSTHHSDPKELNLLGKLYLNMDQLGLAEKAYLDLYRVENPVNNNTLYTLLNIQLAMNNYQLDQRLEGLFDNFVLRNQENESLLLYYGTVLFENQKIDKSMYFFSLLADRYPEGSENRNMILNMIATLTNGAEMGGANGMNHSAQGPGQQQSQQQSQQSSQQQSQTAENATTSTPIAVSIEQNAVSAEALSQDAVLYLFVRKNEVGPPLAAKRIPLGAMGGFPVNLTITDADLLMPGAGLSEQLPLTLSAKISMNGDPISKAGDIEAKPMVIEALDTPVVLTLDHIVE